MRFVTFAIDTRLGRVQRLGVLDAGGNIVDLNSTLRIALKESGSATADGAAHIANALLPGSMRRFLEGGEMSLDAARRALDFADGFDGDDSDLRFRPQDVTPLAPVTDPPLIRDFMAFQEHVDNIYPRLGRQIPDEWFEMPVYYKGNPASVGGPGQPVCLPSYAPRLDFEFEFAAVIGRPGVNIPAADASRYIFGYTIYNDFSARDIQRRELAVGLGPAKAKDFRGAHVFGPCLVTADDIEDPYSLAMTAHVNDELWCSSSTSGMHWTFEEMIEHASRDEELQPGEIFGSGTVGNGSGAERDTSFGPGDEFRLEIEGIGILRNAIVAATSRDLNERA